MTQWPTASNILRSLPVPKEDPLWRRTQLRLQNMERFTRRLANTSIGYDAKSLAMESAVHALGQLLVAQLEERERNQL